MQKALFPVSVLNQYPNAIVLEVVENEIAPFLTANESMYKETIDLAQIIERISGKRSE